MQHKLYKNLFLRQSYLDAFYEYQKSLTPGKTVIWDYVILTASNAEQAAAYEMQIRYRLDQHWLPQGTSFVVLPDPDGKRVGSGGATLNVLKYLREQSAQPNCFAGKRILVIHSGGDSKRVPQYSACGKLFSPVPRELPFGRRSTLFDEFIIAMSGVPARMKDGLLVLSGDVLLLFNHLQIDYHTSGVAALSIKESVVTGQNHGVYLCDDHGHVGRFLHKIPADKLRQLGAVNAQDNVDLDTGAILLGSKVLQDLLALISRDGQVDAARFAWFVNDKIRLSFYGDFLYPMASQSILAEYLKEPAEGEYCNELVDCRRQLWQVMHPHTMRLLRFSPAEFIHFGTTRELLELVTNEIEDYQFLDWKRQVQSYVPGISQVASNNSFIAGTARLAGTSYIEDSRILGDSIIGDACVITNVTLDQVTVPDRTVVHGLKLNDGRYVVRVFGIDDNPKATLEKKATFLGQPLSDFLQRYQLVPSDLWLAEPHDLWTAALYPVCATMAEAVQASLSLFTRFDRSRQRLSLAASFNQANVLAIMKWQNELVDWIRVESILDAIRRREPVDQVRERFDHDQVTDRQKDLLLAQARIADFSLQMRIYFYLSRLIGGEAGEKLENECFKYIQASLTDRSSGEQFYNPDLRICQDAVTINLPVRVNWGGGWSDTPPYCNEQGGTVLNAAIRLNGRLPIQVEVRRLTELVVALESTDTGEQAVFANLDELLEFDSPFNPFALHKAALIACGVFQAGSSLTLPERLQQLGGGFALATKVVNIPKGSGLGTSSILAGACVLALYQFFGETIASNAVYDKILCIEQLMSTGGGWQDQVGGLTPGIKLITTQPGLHQDIQVQPVVIPPAAYAELERRFCIIYTGQRRLARNLLRDIVGKYIGSDPDILSVLARIQQLAVLMRHELEKGRIDNFADLLNQHWELSKRLDQGCTNTCIDLIFMTCEDLLAGKMICGAGGGGFLQVILKEPFTADDLKARLNSVFQESGVDVWSCEFDRTLAVGK